jgi:3-deoxy-D-manno-octulosonate 8-phosphate phosphatase (KDO 8-P phosphatase)
LKHSKLEIRNLKLKPNSQILERARRIKLLLMDCDGVLTDGRIWLTADGDEQKTFHVRDGQGIVLLHRAGVQTGIISGRASAATERRARELGMTFLRQGVTEKVLALDEVLREAGVSPDECGYIGDDVGDVEIMKRVGLAVAVADAADAAKHVAHFITTAAGGKGAVREVCETILQAQEYASRTSA